MARWARASGEALLSTVGTTGPLAKDLVMNCETTTSIVDIATEAAERLNLTGGRNNRWRGRCPACSYGKHTLELAVEQDRIAVSCNACGNIAGIAAAMGIPRDLVIAPNPKPSNVARALDAWHRAMPAAGSLVETYLQGRGITCPPPASIRFLPRQRNWSDDRTYAAMIALVQRVPWEDASIR
jgi:hypothetical protein